jgi:hypothetical protein
MGRIPGVIPDQSNSRTTDKTKGETKSGLGTAYLLNDKATLLSMPPMQSMGMLNQNPVGLWRITVPHIDPDNSPRNIKDTFLEDAILSLTVAIDYKSPSADGSAL